jgi:hypothetical protein
MKTPAVAECKVPKTEKQSALEVTSMQSTNVIDLHLQRYYNFVNEPRLETRRVRHWVQILCWCQ